MPQMSPMDWFFLSIFFLVIYLFFMVYIYFCFNNILENDFKNFNFNVYSLKW